MWSICRSYAIESGLSDKLGGSALSITNALLFATPLMLRWVQRPRCVARCGRVFLLSGRLFLAAAARPLPAAVAGC
jgi:MFS transporter, ACDE family, multidrug resistance protein